MSILSYFLWACVFYTMYSMVSYLRRFYLEEVIHWIYGSRVEKYLCRMIGEESKGLKEISEYSTKLGNGIMMSSPISGKFMKILCQMLKPEKTLDIGVFTGYSALAVASELEDDGKVYALEYDPKMMETATKFWEKANVDHKIVKMIGKASDSLDELISKDHENTFDFAFIDADKVNYIHYYNKTMKLLKVGGVIVIDNVLWRGSFCKDRFAIRVISFISKFMKKDTGNINFSEEGENMKRFNEAVLKDERSESMILPVDDGLYFIRKVKN